jgi:hypothetical protein
MLCIQDVRAMLRTQEVGLRLSHLLRIQEVWASNFHSEVDILRLLVVFFNT